MSLRDQTRDLDMEVADRPHDVYRVFDIEDRLIYIGCAHDVAGRMYMHQVTLSEAGVYGHRVESVEYPNRRAALAAERAAIKAEAPWLNRQGNPTRYRLVRGRGYEPVGPEYADLIRGAAQRDAS